MTIHVPARSAVKAAALSLLGAAFVLGAPISSFAPAAYADDAVVAKLNGKEIRESDLALADQEIGAELHNMSPANRRRVLLEYYIEVKLLAGAAEEAKLNAGEEFEKRADYWRQRALSDEFFQKNIKASVSEGLAKGIYDDKVKMIPEEEEVEARHILVDSEEKAKELSERAKKGDDFAKLAEENSKDPGSKADGGKLGFFGKGQMVKEFEDAAFGLQKGEISAPVKSQFGWHIIKVEDRRKKPLPTFDEVKERIMASVVQQKRGEVTKGLREKAQLEYVDSEIKLQVEQEASKSAAMKKQMEEQMKKMDEQQKK